MAAHLDTQKIGMLFPGQGAQAVGMGQALHARLEVARQRFAQANDILGYDLARVCFEGPESKLNATEFCQPALFVCSIVAVDALRIEHPEWIEQTVATAGLSLGEYTAVCFADGLTFEAALKLVQLRGRAMQAASDQVKSGMSSVLGLDLEKLTAVCDRVRGDDEVLRPANLLCPGNIAVSGHKAALARLEPAAIEAGAMKVIPLSVAGAFHTSLMQPAVEGLQQAIKQAHVTDSRIPVYSNVDGRPHRVGQEFCELLAKQVVTPVRWEDSIRAMAADGIEKFIEVGTGRVLRGTLKRIDRKMAVDGYGDE